MEAKLELQNLDDTAALGQTLGQHIQAGTIVVLSGDLGAGKTQLAGAIARGLGIEDSVTSPTFAILKNYPMGRIPLNHMDLYRLDSPEQLGDIGFLDLLAEDEPSAILIEWGEMFDEVSSRADLIVTMRMVDVNERQVILKAQTDKGKNLIEHV